LQERQCTANCICANGLAKHTFFCLDVLFLLVLAFAAKVSFAARRVSHVIHIMRLRGLPKAGVVNEMHFRYIKVTLLFVLIDFSRDKLYVLGPTVSHLLQLE
jgi:hypothetical protein